MTLCHACLAKDDRYPHTCMGKVKQAGSIHQSEPGSHHHTFTVSKVTCDCHRRYPTSQGFKDYHGPSCQAGKQVKSETTPKQNPNVYKPSHYALFEDVEAIEIIARSMTVEMFKGYCLGNVLKYRLRAGKKTDKANLEQDLDKAAFYVTLFGKYKGMCYDAE